MAAKNWLGTGELATIQADFDAFYDGINWSAAAFT